MFSKSFLLLLLCTPLVRGIILQCENRKNIVCSSNVAHPNSTEYGLLQEFQEKYGNVLLTVFWKSSCPDLSTVGPTWYRLEAIGPTKGKGFFLGVNDQWSILREDNAIEFVNTNEPSVILDLPRKFNWQNTTYVKQHCFKLTIQHENSCQQILSPNCEDINDTGHNITTATTTAPTQATTVPPTDPPTLTPPDKCRSCDNVKVTSRSLTCGSDGIVYPHVCYLRRRRCLYDKSLQRDRTWKSCETAITPPSATPTPANENSDYKCLFDKRLNPNNKLKCDCQGLYKPVQCSQEGTQITCRCYSRAGSINLAYESWTFNCTQNLLSQQCTNT